MKGSKCKFVKHMEVLDTRFVIPAYQKNYESKPSAVRRGRK